MFRSTSSKSYPSPDFPVPPDSSPGIPAQRGASLRGSAPLRIAGLLAGDTEPLRAVFEGLSATSRFRRFHTGRSRLTAGMEQRLADLETGRHEAHVAVLADRAVGIVRWIRSAEDQRSAELAIEVIDAEQSTGIGRQLAAQAARSALAAGVRCFLAYIDEGNQELRNLTLSYGGTVDRDDRGLLRLPVEALLMATDAPTRPTISGSGRSD